jgi:hypothetical protein
MNNNVGKITIECYTTQILPALREELINRKLVLCQDANLAYTSPRTAKWAKKHGIDLLNLPSDSPDMSIIESLAHPIKHKFYSRRIITESAALARFTRIWDREVDEDSIQRMYGSYTKRFHDIRRANGQMSQY